MIIIYNNSNNDNHNESKHIDDIHTSVSHAIIIRPLPKDAAAFGKGKMGSALMGSLQISCALTEGPFGYCRLPTCFFPKVPGRTFFPNLSKTITFAAAPLVLTPFVRNRGLREAVRRDPRLSGGVVLRGLVLVTVLFSISITTIITIIIIIIIICIDSISSITSTVNSVSISTSII